MSERNGVFVAVMKDRLSGEVSVAMNDPRDLSGCADLHHVGYPLDEQRRLDLRLLRKRLSDGRAGRGPGAV